MHLCLKDVAQSAKMTEFEYSSAIFSFLEKGDIINLLNIEAQADICDWINNNSLLNGNKFCLEIHVSMNQNTNIVIYCLCKMDLMGDEPKVIIDKNVMGLPNKKPKDFDNLISYAITIPMLIKEDCPKEDQING